MAFVERLKCFRSRKLQHFPEKGSKREGIEKGNSSRGIGTGRQREKRRERKRNISWYFCERNNDVKCFNKSILKSWQNTKISAL